MDVPQSRKWPLVKVFQVISPGARVRCNPVGSFPSWGQLPGIRVSYVSHNFSKYQISSIISSLWARLNSSTRVLHKFTSAGMIASALYVKENGVSPVDLRGVIRYAHKTLGSSSAQFPMAPSNLFFNPLRIVLLMASACPLL